MISKINIIKAICICAILSAIHTYYTASSVFMLQVENWGEEMGRFQSFMHIAKITEGFWPHIIQGWGVSFGLALLSCMLLLTWIKCKTLDKTSKVPK